MKYRERQEETDCFMDGDELLRAFRGRGKDVVREVRRLTLAAWDIQKAVDDSTIYRALNRAPTWSRIVRCLEDLLGEVEREPRKHCEPPEIADDWPTTRAAMQEYAPANWWFETLKLEDLTKESTFRTALSRDTKPRTADEIIERAKAWRADCLTGLASWEKAQRDMWGWRDIIQFRVKDALDQGGRDAAMAEFLSLIRFDNHPSFEAFDPQYPLREPLKLFDVPDDAEARFEELLASGFPDYRPDEPTPDRVAEEEELVGFYSDDLTKCWESRCVVEAKYCYDHHLRREVRVSSRPLRVLVRVPASWAEDGEEVKQYAKFVGWSRGPQRERVYDGFSYVERWRDVDVYDNVGITEGRDRVLMEKVGPDEMDDPQSYLDPTQPPLDDVSVRDRSDYSR